MGLNCGLRSSRSASSRYPQARAAFSAAMPCLRERPSGAAAETRLTCGRPRVDGRSGHANAGAHAIDPVGGRAVRFRVRLCGGAGIAGGSAFAGLGQPIAVADGLPAVGRADDGRHHLVPQFRALDHRGDHRFRARAAAHRDRQVQRQGQSDALEDHPQHPAGSGLDGDPGRHPGGDRDPVVPHPVRAAQHAAVRPHHQGDRQPVELDLHLSGREDRVHLDHADRGGRGRSSIHRRRGCSASTTRSSCR